jgi:hypothetical protein
MPDSDFLLCKPEQFFDEPDLTPNIIAAQPPNLPLPHHVHRLIALNGSPGRMKFPETLLGVDPAFDRAMVLLKDVVQVLDWAMPTWPAKRPFLLNSGDGWGIDGRQIGIDDARLRMGSAAQSLAKQALGSIGIPLSWE